MDAWRELLITFAVVALAASVWAQLVPLLMRLPRRLSALLTGSICGLGAVGAMASSAELSPGVYIDIRTSMIALSALVGGALAALMSVVIASLFRLMQGGAGAPVGIALIASSALVGLLVRKLLMNRKVRLRAVAVTAASVSLLAGCSVFLLPGAGRDFATFEIALPTAFLTGISIMMIGLTIAQTSNGAWETHLLRAALAQAPNFFYVKNRRSQFIATNRAVARHHGYERPEDIEGKSDFDLESPERAAQLFADEQKLVATGTTIENRLECVKTHSGIETWFETSKVALRDRHGETIGLTGVSVDVTARMQLEAELRAANVQLQALARTDSLTGLANRRDFDRELALAFEAARRSRRPLSVLMVDVDSFKAYNDRYGHPQGDECLKAVAGALLAALHRPADIAARYGGEEFAALLPDTDSEGALLVAERFRLGLATLALTHAASSAGIVTASVGVASMGDTRMESAADLVALADTALYEAKSGGRNQVRLAAGRGERLH
jgi:diguanylate cyclase (GGDEF)-like protein/PAS domain S-box-containing protein